MRKMIVELSSVIPAQAGIHWLFEQRVFGAVLPQVLKWFPAYAGMTNLWAQDCGVGCSGSDNVKFKAVGL